MALYIGIKNLIGKGAAWMRSTWATILTQLAAEFRFRLAGGLDNSSLPERKGRAVLQKVYGKTVKFNQLVDTNTTTVMLVSGHIYYTKISGTASVVTGAGNSMAVTGGVDTVIDLTAAEIDNLTTVEEFEAWLALNVGTQDYYPYDEGSLISFGGTALKSVGRNVWDGTYSKRNAYLSNSGAEVTNTGYNISSYIKVFPSTNYYFSAIFPSNAVAASIGWYDNSKKFISAVSGANNVNNKILTSPVNAMYLRATILPDLVSTAIINISDSKNGTYEPYWENVVDLSHAYINVWDEQWELGGIVGATGQNFVANNRIRSINYIPINPSLRYYLKSGTITQINIFQYGADKSFIRYLTEDANNIITIHSECRYIRFCSPSGYTTYNHDICINVSNADVNGTYFPHALQSAGSVSDEVTETETKKKLRETAIFNNLTWTYGGVDSARPYGYLRTPITDGKSFTGEIVSSSNNFTKGEAAFNVDKVMFIGSGYLYFINSAYTSVADFLAAEGNNTAIYELATPITIPHDDEMRYKVDKYSTEEVIVPASADGTPTSTNIVADIEYQAK